MNMREKLESASGEQLLLMRILLGSVVRDVVEGELDRRAGFGLPGRTEDLTGRDEAEVATAA